MFCIFLNVRYSNAKLMHVGHQYVASNFDPTTLKGYLKDKNPNRKIDISDYLKEHKVVRKKLSKAAMETLSIIAYFQPITKPEIEEIRGVSTHSGIFEILFSLL